MPTTSFTTRMDQNLKSELEKIARYEERSASYIANKAISAFVEERKLTHELVQTGLKLADQGISISESAVDEWMTGPDDAPFPAPESES